MYVLVMKPANPFYSIYKFINKSYNNKNKKYFPAKYLLTATKNTQASRLIHFILNSYYNCLQEKSNSQQNEKCNKARMRNN